MILWIIAGNVNQPRNNPDRGLLRYRVLIIPDQERLPLSGGRSRVYHWWVPSVLRYHDHWRCTRVGGVSVWDGSRDGVIVCFVVGRWEGTHKPARDVDGRRGNYIGHHIIVTKARGRGACHRRQKGSNGWQSHRRFDRETRSLATRHGRGSSRGSLITWGNRPTPACFSITVSPPLGWGGFRCRVGGGRSWNSGGWHNR